MYLRWRIALANHSIGSNEPYEFVRNTHVSKVESCDVEWKRGEVLNALMVTVKKKSGSVALRFLSER